MPLERLGHLRINRGRSSICDLDENPDDRRDDRRERADVSVAGARRAPTDHAAAALASAVPSADRERAVLSPLRLWPTLWLRSRLGYRRGPRRRRRDRRPCCGCDHRRRDCRQPGQCGGPAERSLLRAALSLLRSGVGHLSEQRRQSLSLPVSGSALITPTDKPRDTCLRGFFRSQCLHSSHASSRNRVQYRVTNRVLVRISHDCPTGNADCEPPAAV